MLLCLPTESNCVKHVDCIFFPWEIEEKGVTLEASRTKYTFCSSRKFSGEIH